MSKILKCSDVVPGCQTEIRGDSEHDVLRKAAEHAKSAHKLESLSPEVLAQVKNAIHDEAGSESRKTAGGAA
jgi:predicted small metal-binding protein